VPDGQGACDDHDLDARKRSHRLAAMDVVYPASRSRCRWSLA